jgi:archaellum component FlaC
MPRVEKAYKDVAKPEAIINVSNKLAPFMQKCEMIVDSELATLEEYI